MESLLSISSSKTGSEVTVTTTLPIKEVSSNQIEPDVASTSRPVSTSEGIVFDAKGVLVALQSKPSFTALQAILRWLAKSEEIKIVGRMSTEIIGVLVNDIATSFWSILVEDTYRKERNWFFTALTSVSGLGALLARLRFVSMLKKGSDSPKNATKPEIEIAMILQILHELLAGDTFCTSIWEDIEHFMQNPLQRTILWKEFVTVLASGKMLSTVAEAISTLSDRGGRLTWLGEGTAFTRWLGQNINALASSSKLHGAETLHPAALIFSRALSLGYKNELNAAAFTGILHGDIAAQAFEVGMFNHLNSIDQTKALSGILIQLDNSLTASKKTLRQQLISGSSALIRLLCKDKFYLQDFLRNWLACVAGGSVGADLGTRRAVVAAVSGFEDNNVKSTKQLLTQFGDKIHIQHASILIQEVCTQNLLLMVGRIFRADRDKLVSLARSGLFINAVSNRLAATTERARFLGMVVGMAVSELVDSTDKRMQFSMPTTDKDDLDWYLELTAVQDISGSIHDLIVADPDQSLTLPARKSSAIHQTKPKIAKQKAQAPISRITVIEEIESSDEDGVQQYQKPDSDASDSDEDPTVINRNKATPPVYVRDLITYLRDTENYDRHMLAMSHAADLIRRKSSYGTEVKDHLEDLAPLLCGLKDEYDSESWQKQRIAAMVAIILANPSTMGKWFANMAFSGDYSMAQRASILTSLTLAGRELAGYSAEDVDLTNAPQNSIFPSKQLPPKYAKLYTTTTQPITNAAHALETRMLAPIAASAIQATSGPQILQTRNISSRLAVAQRTRRIPNALATQLTEHFFFPLTNRWRIYTLTHGTSTGASNIFATPFLQAHLLKTLALLLSAAGASTISLPLLTTEYWSLLLSRPIWNAAREALPVLEAVLFGLLTILDVNGAGMEGEDSKKRRLATEYGGLLVETRELVGSVMQSARMSSVTAVGKEEERVAMLTAAVLVRVEEVIERYQRLLVGELAGA